MDIFDLHEASYRGAFFFVKGSDIEGGRKDTKKEFVDSDRQIIEDLGLKQRVFTVKGDIAARYDTDGNIVTTYFQARDTLLAALESDAGPGILIHPWYGRLTDIVCRTFSLSEDDSKLGDAQISIVFEISNIEGISVSNQFALTRVSQFHSNLLDSMKEQLSDIWEVTDIKIGNVQAAMDKVNSFVDAINTATDPIAAVADEINKHTNFIANLSANVATLVSAPVDLADSVNSALDSIGGLYSTAKGTLEAFENLFDFGDNDINSIQSTSISIERKSNNDILNSVVQSGALGYAYLSAAQIDYETVEDIIEVTSRLDIQYQKLLNNSDINQEIMDSLTDLRVITQNFFEQQKLNVSQIITVTINPMSTRTVAFNYYGSSDQGEKIAELNGVYDLAYHQGDIRIFTA